MNQSYEVGLMRRHLACCIEDKIMRPFQPRREPPRKCPGKQAMKVHRTCRLPKQEGDKMICCTCHQWFQTTVLVPFHHKQGQWRNCGDCVGLHTCNILLSAIECFYLNLFMLLMDVALVDRIVGVPVFTRPRVPNLNKNFGDVRSTFDCNEGDPVPFLPVEWGPELPILPWHGGSADVTWPQTIHVAHSFLFTESHKVVYFKGYWFVSHFWC